MRDKEKLHDYRFMPEPNLPPIRLYDTASLPAVAHDQIINIDELRGRLPELPTEQRRRLSKVYELSEDHSDIIVNEPGLKECYEKCLRARRERNAQSTANLFLNELLSALNERNITFTESALTAEKVGDVVDLVQNKIIALTAARQIFDLLLVDPTKSPQRLIKELNLTQVNDNDAILHICEKVLANNQKAVAEYKSGKVKLLNFFVGQVQKEFKGKSNAKTVTDILKQKLL